MKSALLERLEKFHAAPFTIQRLSELLTDPKKHYSRLDKFMRALEKNILGEYALWYSLSLDTHGAFLRQWLALSILAARQSATARRTATTS